MRGKEHEFRVPFSRGVGEHALRYLWKERVSGEGSRCGVLRGYHPICSLDKFQFDNIVDTFPRATWRRVMMTVVSGYRIENAVKYKWEEAIIISLSSEKPKPE